MSLLSFGLPDLFTLCFGHHKKGSPRFYNCPKFVKSVFGSFADAQETKI